MKLAKYVAYVAILLKFCNSFVKDSSKVGDELDIFIDTLKLCPELDNHTCFYSNINSESTRDIANIFKRKIKCGTLVLNTNKSQNVDVLTFEVKNFFVLVETAEGVASAAAELIENPLWKPDAYSFFIITSEVEDLSFLPGVLSYIWSKNILDFLLIFVHHNYQAYTYLPFAEERILNVKKSNLNFCECLALDKANNFNGHLLRAAFYDYPPSVYKENGTWTGIDLEIFLLLAEILNATSKIIPCPDANSTAAKLFSNEADIFLLKIFQVSVTTLKIKKLYNIFFRRTIMTT